MDWNELYKKLDQQVREGHFESAKAELIEIKSGELPREMIEHFADLCRRVRLDSWGLHLLRPIIRPKHPIHPEPNTGEWTMYAALLIKIGALDEAFEILEEQSEASHPSVLLYSAFAYFARWDYQASSEKLIQYVNLPKLDDYKLAVATVNLVGSLVYLEKYSEALTYLNALIPRCERNQWKLLLGNCFEISAQISIQLGQWGQAEGQLKKAQALISGHHQYELFIEKHFAKLKLLKNPTDSASRAGLIQVREKALMVNEWETVRDCDRIAGEICNDAELSRRVFFGTPFESYKNRLESYFRNSNAETGESYLWLLNDVASKNIFDMNSLSTETSDRLKHGQLVHRLLSVLTSDFYQSFTIGTLFSKLFPDEYYNHETAPDRVFQAVRTLRTWFQKSSIPIEIQSEKNQYRLIGLEPCAIRVYKEKKIVSSDEFYLSQIRQEFLLGEFSSGQASEVTGLSPTAVRLVLKRALASNFLWINGKGRSTTYKFIS